MPEPRMTGYDTDDTYFATKYTQGGRQVYSIDLSLAAVAQTLPKPDPEQVTTGNRRVNVNHARKFAKYVRENEDWVAPAIQLRSPDIFKFETKERVGGTMFGILSLPRRSRPDLQILDGQHRILGLCYAVEEIAEEMGKIRSDLSGARRQNNGGVVKELEKKKAVLESQRERLEQERISVQIHIEDVLKSFKQMFVDIAVNALGIKEATKVMFDTRKVANRAIPLVLEHPLLKDRVDLENDRILGPNPNLLGARHVGDIIRAIAVGIGSRITPRLEDELDEHDLASDTMEFFTLLTESFPPLNQISKGEIRPPDLRGVSLLGSSTMLRMLAGTYRILKGSNEMSVKEIGSFFGRVAPFMRAPIEPSDPWLECEPAFSEGATAPMARQGDMLNVVRMMVRWARSNPTWMQQAA